MRPACGRLLRGQGAAGGEGGPAEDNANLVLPDANATPDEVDASPIADAVKTALATALAVVKGDI